MENWFNIIFISIPDTDGESMAAYQFTFGMASLEASTGLYLIAGRISSAGQLLHVSLLGEEGFLQRNACNIFRDNAVRHEILKDN